MKNKYSLYTIRIFNLFILLGLSAFFLCNSSGLVRAEEGFTPAQKAEINALFKDYIKQNGELIIQSVQEYQIKKQQEEEKNAQSKLKEHLAFLTAADAPSAGNAKGDVTVIEFFDYNCGYCKKALPDIQGIIGEDPNVRVVLRDMPVLGPSSELAARWAMAAHKQGKYFEYHVALMGFQGMKDEQSLEKLAKDIGLDVEKLKADAQSEDIIAALKKEMDIVRDLGLRGTPAFIVGEDIYRGYIGLDGLKDAVTKARKK